MIEEKETHGDGFGFWVASLVCSDGEMMGLADGFGFDGGFGSAVVAVSYS